MNVRTRRVLGAIFNYSFAITLGCSFAWLLYHYPGFIQHLFSYNLPWLFILPLLIYRTGFSVSRCLQFSIILPAIQLVMFFLLLVFTQLILTTGPRELLVQTFNSISFEPVLLPICASLIYGLALQYFKHRKLIQGLPGQLSCSVYPGFIKLRAERYIGFVYLTCNGLLYALTFTAAAYLFMRNSSAMAYASTSLGMVSVLTCFMLSLFGNSKYFVRKIKMLTRYGYGYGAIFLLFSVIMIGLMWGGQQLIVPSSHDAPSSTLATINLLGFYKTLSAMLPWLFVPLLGSVIARLGNGVPVIIQSAVVLAPGYMFNFDLIQIAPYLRSLSNIFELPAMVMTTLVLLILCVHTWRERTNRPLMIAFDKFESRRFFGLGRFAYYFINMPMLLVTMFSVTGWFGLYFLLGVNILSLFVCTITVALAVIKLRLTDITYSLASARTSDA